MHKSSMLRMKWFVDNYVSKIDKNPIKVLDVGSCDVYGAYKPLFNDQKFQYEGLDIVPGPNVDIIMHNPYNWKELKTDSYDIVISGQTFEHSEFVWVTMAEIARVLKKDGITCIIAPNGFGEHRHPVDCYRFFSDGMIALARYVSLEPLHAHTNAAPAPYHFDWYSFKRSDTMLVARKPYSGEVQYVNLSEYICIPPIQEKLRENFRPLRTGKQKIKYFFYAIRHPKRWKDAFKFVKECFTLLNLR